MYSVSNLQKMAFGMVEVNKSLVVNHDSNITGNRLIGDGSI